MMETWVDFSENLEPTLSRLRFTVNYFLLAYTTHMCDTDKSSLEDNTVEGLIRLV